MPNKKLPATLDDAATYSAVMFVSTLIARVMTSLILPVNSGSVVNRGMIAGTFGSFRVRPK